MYNFEYFQKWSNLQWMLVFVLLSLVTMVWMLLSSHIDANWKLLAAIGIVISLVTPLGSNNQLWPLINNLFFIAPLTIWHLYKMIRHASPTIGFGRLKLSLFPLKAMLAAIVIAVFVQSMGVGLFHVFRDGEDGEARNTRIEGNAVLRGMRTTASNAAILQEITAFTQQYPDDVGLILFGNIPALSYYLNRPSALSNVWPILDSFDPQQFESELNSNYNHPLIIVATTLPQWSTVAKKSEALEAFITKHGYQEVFRNKEFIVYT
jgi:hypothetical protein